VREGENERKTREGLIYRRKRKGAKASRQGELSPYLIQFKMKWRGLVPAHPVRVIKAAHKEAWIQ
jgi:hypothetical protein